MLLVLLTACSVQFPDTVPDGDTDPGTDPPPAAERCDEPGDEDGDGLADCEDTDCADVCTESACDDGEDDDGDGRIDCDDEDCWGLGACTGRTLEVLAVGPTIRSVTRTVSSTICPGTTVANASVTQWMELRDVSGLVRRIGPGGARSCTFHATLHALSRVVLQDGIATRSTHSVTGVPVASVGCPLPGSAQALWNEIALVPTASGRILDADGGVWFSPETPADLWNHPLSETWHSTTSGCVYQGGYGYGSTTFPVRVGPDTRLTAPLE